jgi:hypothetical protein
MSKIIVPRTIHVFVSLVLCTVSIVSLANTDSTMAMLEALESEWNQASVLDCAPKFSLGNSTSFRAARLVLASPSSGRDHEDRIRSASP